MLKRIALRVSVFLGLSFAFFLVSGVVLAFNEKVALHYEMNQFHSNFWDFFFKYYTNVGEGYFALFLIPILFLSKKKKFLLFGILSCVFAGILAQLFKHYFFPDAPRPTAVFNAGVLHLVSGVKMAKLHSFVSGHSASAFAMFMFASVVYHKKWLQIVFFLMAMLVAISRVYLSQHFLMDVFVGSCLGIFSVFLAFEAILLFEKITATNKNSPSLSKTIFA